MRARAYHLVIETIEDAITQGRAAVGDRLPAERDLAVEVGVSRTAVREALRALEAMGVVSAGVGRDGGTVLTSLSAGALTRWLRLHVLLGSFPMGDVVEARVMFERHSARLAAAEAGRGQLARLGEVLDAMETPDIGAEEFNELDTAFHVAIAEATGNGLVAELTTAVRSSMESAIMASLDTDATWRTIADDLRRDHRAVLAALEDGDGEEAAERMEQHIRSSYARLQYRDAAGGHLR